MSTSFHTWDIWHETCGTRHLSSSSCEKKRPQTTASAIFGRGGLEFEAPRSANCNTPSNSGSRFPAFETDILRLFKVACLLAAFGRMPAGVLAFAARGD